MNFGLADDSFPTNATLPEQAPTLSDWTAAEISAAFTRLRPHLVSCAKKYVSGYEAEEVVQDSFLYVLSALPELKGDDALIKFLKWKTKMLCLDIKRSKASQLEHSVDDFSYFESSSPGVDSEIERAEDSAVVRLALAKLNPRHREALIYSVYEEASVSDIAGRMALTENSTRQLLFRARAAFRRALVGEAETQGKSMNEILSLAVGKAKAEAGKGVVAGLSILMLIGIPFALASNNGSPDASLPLASPGVQQPVEDKQPLAESQEALATPDFDSTPVPATTDTQIPAEPIEQLATNTVEPIAVSTVPAVQPALAMNTEGSVLELPTVDLQTAGTFEEALNGYEFAFQGQPIEVYGGTAMSAFIDLDPETSSFSSMLIRVDSAGNILTGVPTNIQKAEFERGQQTAIEIIASDFKFLNNNGRLEQPNKRYVVVIGLILDQTGVPVSASLKTLD